MGRVRDGAAAAAMAGILAAPSGETAPQGEKAPMPDVRRSETSVT